LAASVVCGIRNLRSCHIEGGELSGTIDESIRHCSTKLCTSHFVSNKQAEKRVILLGESPDRIFNIGSPELDMHVAESGVEIGEVKTRYEICFQDYGIVIFHPVTTEMDTIKRQAKSLFDALNHTGRNYVVIAPNNDPGSDEIFSIIEQLPKQNFKIIPSMRFSHFSELMKNASIMIGNSSAGVREAPFLGLPSINVGTRQNKRASENQTYNCNAECINELIELVNKNWGVRNGKSEYFGTGNASVKFLEVIINKSFWELPIQKSYHEEIL
jgi:UDP-N-acetylglucosamine 2-epimerase (hydrolysing)